MAGPSKEAQSLMSTRAKNLIGQSKLDAGIKAQQGVETMKSQIPSSSSSLPAPNAAWAKANPKLATAYVERQRTYGTAQSDNPLMRDTRGSLPQPKLPTTQTPTAPPQPQIKPPTSGLTDADRKRIDDFRALGPLQKLQQRSTIEKELQQMTPEKRKEIMDYYNR
jgi:hypothetical protein